MQKTTPFLWFDGQAGEDAKFYTSIFKQAHQAKNKSIKTNQRREKS
jgi:predicted 3-demethylubiquinone-9 3-methyltransferase (glyoxalase superfamily)